MTKKAFTPTPERAPALLIWHRRCQSARLVWGFTLIELLVVVALIGLLASIVLASIKSFQERASIAKTLTYGKSVDNLLAADAVGIWNFDEGSGNIAKDTSGWANNGTINGATFTDDTPHKAAGAGAGKYSLSFDGNDYVSKTGLNPSLSKDLTVSAWIKSIYVQTGQARMLDLGLQLCMNAAGQIGIDNSGGPTGGVWTSTAKNDGTWHYMVVVREGAVYKVYVDGVNVGSIGGTVPTYTQLFIGTSSGLVNYFNGTIDEVRIFTRALTQTEIQKLYAEGLEGHSNFVSQ